MCPGLQTRSEAEALGPFSECRSEVIGAANAGKSMFISQMLDQMEEIYPEALFCLRRFRTWEGSVGTYANMVTLISFCFHGGLRGSWRFLSGTKPRQKTGRKHSFRCWFQSLLLLDSFFAGYDDGLMSTMPLDSPIHLMPGFSESNFCFVSSHFDSSFRVWLPAADDDSPSVRWAACDVQGAILETRVNRSS